MRSFDTTRSGNPPCSLLQALAGPRVRGAQLLLLAVACGPSERPGQRGLEPAAGESREGGNGTRPSRPEATWDWAPARGWMPKPVCEHPAPVPTTEPPTGLPGPERACPRGMVPVAGFCIDRWEAPNRLGTQPLVMYSFDEAAGWCAARGKRLCYDDEWTRACAGGAGLRYPYGDDHRVGWCNDDKLWRVFDQSLLEAWPPDVSSPAVDSLAQLLASAAAVSTAAAASAEHVRHLYQADGSGQRAQCRTADGVHDLCGNVEEWTRRRAETSRAQFPGSLKGRYWAESWDCGAAVTSHGASFRFYETGFRCCVARLFGPSAPNGTRAEF
jgi:hypothetical protein